MHIQHTLILNQHSRTALNRTRVVALLNLLSVHISAVLAHDIQLRVVKHFAEFLELVFGLGVVLLLLAHALEGLEVCAVFDEARDVDLRADEVADGAAGVEERGHHEEVHEGGAVAAAKKMVRLGL